MRHLSQADITFLTGHGPVIVTAIPMARRQGNGHLTGFVRQTYSDGAVVDAEFIVNARSAEDVRLAYAASGLR